MFKRENGSTLDPPLLHKEDELPQVPGFWVKVSRTEGGLPQVPAASGPYL